MMNVFPLVLVFGVAIALIFLGVGLLFKTRRFRGKAKPVDAVVVDVEEFGDVREDGLGAYRLSCEYTAADGRVIQTEQSVLKARSPQVGTNLTMLADPQAPEKLRVTGAIEYLIPMVFLIVGVVLLFIIAILR
jgi:hypothetical protein